MYHNTRKEMLEMKIAVINSCSNINKIREDKCTSTVDIEISSGTYCYDVSDDIAKDIATMVIANQLFNEPLPSYWRTSNNQNQTVTKQDLIDISIAMKQYILAVGERSHYIKDVLVPTAHTCEELMQICEDFRQWQPL